MATVPRRADARRNLERVLIAAREAFAQEGLDAQMPDIAHRAGVGVGTIYRHFPTKEALIGALADDHFARLVELAETAVAADGDPWEAFAGMIWRSARMYVEDRGLAEIVASRPRAMSVAGNARYERLQAAAGTLVARGVQAGAIRPDASAEDIGTMMCGLGTITTLQRCGKPVAWERYVTIMLDGLRPRPAPAPAP
nr:TetR/AcrR family transcriptional regulator [Solirubrobacterales bacterium]